MNINHSIIIIVLWNFGNRSRFIWLLIIYQILLGWFLNPINDKFICIFPLIPIRILLRASLILMVILFFNVIDLCIGLWTWRWWDFLFGCFGWEFFRLRDFLFIILLYWRWSIFLEVNCWFRWLLVATPIIILKTLSVSTSLRCFCLIEGCFPIL